MGRNDDKRNFALRETSGDETSLFTGTTPWQAALKAARQLTPIGDEQDAKRRELALRETGQRKSTFTKSGPGKKTLPTDRPEWMPKVITQANVRKQHIEHLEEI